MGPHRTQEVAAYPDGQAQPPVALQHTPRWHHWHRRKPRKQGHLPPLLLLSQRTPNRITACCSHQLIHALLRRITHSLTASIPYTALPASRVRSTNEHQRVRLRDLLPKIAHQEGR